VLCVEWLDPLYLAGHWVPELVAAAGGIDVGAVAGSHSTRRSWRSVADLRPDLIVVMLCGFGVDRARDELRALDCPEASGLLESAPIWIIDGNAFTSRPGPRVVDGAERLRAAMEGREMEGLERWQPAA
jgi:iron complex transport system substrate-binding protein